MDTPSRPRRSLVRDVVAPVAAAAVLLLAVQAARGAGWESRDAVGYAVVIVLAAAAWTAAWSAPRTTLVTTALVVAAPMWTFAPGARIAPLVVAALVAALRGVRPALLVPVYAVGLVLGLTVDTTSLVWRFRDWGVIIVALYGDNVQKVLIGLVATAVVLLGALTRRQRVSAAALRERTAQVAALRREEDARIVAETRTAIARDIHDVVAHHMTAVVVTAQSAATDPRRDGEVLHDSMVTIAAEGQEALAAMRRAVRVLRTDAADAVDDRTPDISPFVHRMADRVRATGRTVSVEGAPGRMPQFAQVAMARIVQEALTNVMLHSNATTVTVGFSQRGEALVLRVADDGSPGPRPSTPGGGNGVRGMRERARAIGGTLTADRGPDGAGWTVTATVPVDGMPTG